MEHHLHLENIFKEQRQMPLTVEPDKTLACSIIFIGIYDLTTSYVYFFLFLGTI